MDENTERRREQRLRYHWPVWFAEDFDELLTQGQMVDVSSAGAAFTCRVDENCPYQDQHIIARFSIPHFRPDESFDMANFTRLGRVCRVDDVSNSVRRVAIHLAEPLPFKPGEQTNSECQTQQIPEAVTI